MIAYGRRLDLDILGYAALVLVVAIGGIAITSSVGSIDNNDYRRAIESFLAGPADGSEYHPFGAPVLDWRLRDPQESPLSARNTASLYFWATMKVQSLFRPTFSLPVLAAISKSFATLGCALLAYRYARMVRFGAWARALLFVGLATCLFMSHTAFLMASFYQEHLFVVAFPFLLYGVLGEPTRRNRIVIVIALTLCGAAKAQYFYMPVLFLVTSWLGAKLGRVRFDRAVVPGIVVAQLICLIPTGKADRDVHRYHATWFGSYLLLKPDELTALGVRPGDLECVGADRWGNRLVAPRTDRIEAGHRSCFEHKRLNLADVLRPYVAHPSLVPAMWALIAATHLTARPFHVDRGAPYIVPSTAAGFGDGTVSLRASEWRDTIVTPHPFLVMALALGVAMFAYRRVGRIELFVAVAFTILFLAAQVPVSVLGDGIRDLSKHLAVAQTCLDIVVVLTLANAAVALGRPRRMRGVAPRIGASA